MPLVLNAARWLGAFTIGFFSNDVASFFGGLYQQFFGSPEKAPPMILGIALPLIIGVVIVGLLIWFLLRPLKKLV